MPQLSHVVSAWGQSARKWSSDPHFEHRSGDGHTLRRCPTSMQLSHLRVSLPPPPPPRPPPVRTWSNLQLSPYWQLPFWKS